MKKIITILLMVSIAHVLLSCPVLSFGDDDPTTNTEDQNNGGGGSSTEGGLLGTTSLFDIRSNITSTNFTHFKIINNGTGESAAVLIVNNEIFIIPVESGSDASSAPSNDISAIEYSTTNSLSGKTLLADVNALVGSTLTTASLRIITNPITKKVYIKTPKHILMINKNGANKLSLSNVALNAVQGAKLSLDAKVDYGSRWGTMGDIVWAQDEGRLYVTAQSNTAGLNGIIAWIQGTFNDGDKITNLRPTSFFQSQDPSGASDAPIEALTYAVFGGVGYLIGNNTCSPGFGIPTSEVRAGTTSITFVETFNGSGLSPENVYTVTTGGTTYLIRSAGGAHQRIAQKFIDGTYNKDPANSGTNAKLFDVNANPKTFTDAEMKVYTTTWGYQSITSVYGDKILVLTSNGASLKTVSL